MKAGKEGKENYLRAIYELYDDKEGVRSMEISRKLNISKASVSEMLRKLAEENLIKIKPYSKILLTKKGEKIAGKLFDKHYTIKTFIKKYLNFDDRKAREEAHKLEHSFSEESIAILNRLIEESKNELKPHPSYVG